MFAKIKTIITHPYWQNLRDVRVLGLLVFAVIMLLTTWSGVRIIETNAVLQQEIARLAKRNELREIENRNIELTNQYYQTDTYLELAARRHYNKGREGESLVLISKEVALAQAPKPTVTEEAVPAQAGPKSKYQQNLENWVDFLFRRDD